MSEEKMNEDTLFLALTRPAMILGVPMEAFAVSCGIGGMAMIVTDNVFFLLLALPLLLISRLIAERDANAFRILFKWLDSSGRCRNRGFWGGTSCSPLRLRRSFKIEEID